MLRVWGSMDARLVKTGKRSLITSESVGCVRSSSYIDTNLSLSLTHSLSLSLSPSHGNTHQQPLSHISLCRAPYPQVKMEFSLSARTLSDLTHMTNGHTHPSSVKQQHPARTLLFVDDISVGHALSVISAAGSPPCLPVGP